MELAQTPQTSSEIIPLLVCHGILSPCKLQNQSERQIEALCFPTLLAYRYGKVGIQGLIKLWKGWVSKESTESKI